MKSFGDGELSDSRKPLSKITRVRCIEGIAVFVTAPKWAIEIWKRCKSFASQDIIPGRFYGAMPVTQ
jgi:hypothetical protein